MDKREALNIYLKVHRECVRSGCKDCAFMEPYNGRTICSLIFAYNNSLAESIRAKLKDMEGKQEVKPSVPLENGGSIIAHGPSTVKEPVPMPEKDGPIFVDTSDNVNSPKHYLKGGLECIQVIKAQLTPQQYEGYLYGNVLKYMWRWADKNGLEDLRKAAKYLEWLQEEVKNNG